MKIAILNDTHMGIRNASDIFLDNAAKFYDETFFPYLKKHNIKQIVHLGDYYDNRKAINVKSLYHNRKHFLEPLRQLGISMDIIPGNHDTYFKNTNNPNSLKELLGFFVNEVAIIEKPTVIKYGSMNMALLPWICADNEQESLDFIKNCDAQMLGGHLELNGFEMHSGIMSDHGMSAKEFSRFKAVFSGHYHTKSSKGNVHYLGSQMEFFWSDCDDKKYFHVLDTETHELTPVRNPHTLFKKVMYDDTMDVVDEDVTGKFVKVIVKNKTNPELFEKFLDKLQEQETHDLKIAENFSDVLPLNEKVEISVDDTQVLLDDYIDATETDLDKSYLKRRMKDIYMEAQSLEVL